MSIAPYFDDGQCSLFLGDCRTVMAGFDAESFDAVVTDPPYGLEFMSVAWDTFSERAKGAARPRSEWGDFGSREHARHPSGVAAIHRRKALAYYEFSLEWAEQCYRVLKPGGWLLAFGHTRLWHRLVCAIEDAGFEIRDSVASLTGQDAPGLMWLNGSGFPKSLDVSKALDKRRDWGALKALQGMIRDARSALGITQSEAARRSGIIAEGETLGGGGFMWFETGMRVPNAGQYAALKTALLLGDSCDLAFEAAEREVLSETTSSRKGGSWADQVNSGIFRAGEHVVQETAPATETAAEWAGFGTALKPAWEPIAVARKPLAGTVAQNVLAYGTGALNIDSCRVRTPDSTSRPRGTFPHSDDAWGNGRPDEVSVTNDAGRWPSNVLLTHSPGCEPRGSRQVTSNQRMNGTVVAARPDQVAKGAEKERVRGARGHGNGDGTETIGIWDCVAGCPVAELDRQTGSLNAGGAKHGEHLSARSAGFMGDKVRRRFDVDSYGDSGGASRFFPVFHYCAKAPTSERPKLPDGTAHSTVKPVSLMSWLIRLVSNRDALILDPFAGSGTTGEACVVEGRQCVLIEREPKFAELVKVRLSKPIQPGMFDLEAT